MKNIDKFKNLKVCEIWEIYKKEQEKDENLTFQDFLWRDDLDWKFKEGDLIQMNHHNSEAKKHGWIHDVVFKILKIYSVKEHNFYHLKMLTPLNRNCLDIGTKVNFSKTFVEDVCQLY